MPPFKKPKVASLARDYRYLRNEEEVSRFLRAAGDEGELVRILYATAVFTGIRTVYLQYGNALSLDRHLAALRESSRWGLANGDDLAPVIRPALANRCPR